MNWMVERLMGPETVCNLEYGARETVTDTELQTV